MKAPLTRRLHLDFVSRQRHADSRAPARARARSRARVVVNITSYIIVTG